MAARSDAENCATASGSPSGPSSNTFGGRSWATSDIFTRSTKWPTTPAGPALLISPICRGAIKLAIEIDGFRTHAQNIDRRQFAYQLHRQNLLIVDGWDILRFSFDDVEARPRRCQQTIQQYMGSRFAVDLRSPAYLDESPRVTVFAREIIRLARGLPRPLAPRDVCEHLGVARPTAYRHLKRLTAQGLLVPASGTKRIRTYRLAPTTQHFYI